MLECTVAVVDGRLLISHDIEMVPVCAKRVSSGSGNLLISPAPTHFCQGGCYSGRFLSHTQQHIRAGHHRSCTAVSVVAGRVAAVAVSVSRVWRVVQTFCPRSRSAVQGSLCTSAAVHIEGSGFDPHSIHARRSMPSLHNQQLRSSSEPVMSLKVMLVAFAQLLCILRLCERVATCD
jgi:hypothetical protein